MLNVGTIHDVLMRIQLSPQAHVGCPSLISKSGVFPSMESITVVIADAHALFRKGLGWILAQQGDIMVVGEAADGLQLLIRTETLPPDILLLDVRIHKIGGLEVLFYIHATTPTTKFFIQVHVAT